MKVNTYNRYNLRLFQPQKLPLEAWTTKVADSGDNRPAGYQMIKNVQLLGTEPQEPIYLNPYQDSASVYAPDPSSPFENFGFTTGLLQSIIIARYNNTAVLTRYISIMYEINLQLVQIII